MNSIGMEISRRRFLTVMGASLTGGGLYGYFVEPTWLHTVDREIEVSGLPESFDGYTIAQLSDLHVGGGIPLDFLDHAVDTANHAQPDLAVVTGDIVDECGHAGAAEEARDVLARLEAKDGTRAVFGNHDTGAYHRDRPFDPAAMRRLARAVNEAGVEMLENRTTWVERGGARIAVTGYGDLWSRRFVPDKVTLGKTTTIALSHNPDTAPELARRGADVILCGHTHGGQVSLPLFGPPYVPVQHQQYLSGYYTVGYAHLYVNPGLGFTHRVRFGARPEVTILRLRRV